MNILPFPETPRPEDRAAGPDEESRAQDAPPTRRPWSDARILETLSALNQPALEAAMSRRPRAQVVLAAFRAEWRPPALRAPRPANDISIL